LVKAEAALAELLHCLKLRGYRHTTVTPKTHETVLSRRLERRLTLADIFGWNRAFEKADLETDLYALLERAEALDVGTDDQFRTKIRVATLGAGLFVHSAFPTDEKDAVFFGPDTYRFVRFLEMQSSKLPHTEVIADIGAGSGAGGIMAASMFGAARTILVDINPRALRYARINAEAAAVDAEFLESDQVPECDLLIGNAPYLMDDGGREYRHGGDLLGGAVSLDWIEQGLRKLRPGGTILLYSGAAYVDGRSPLLDAVEDACRAEDARLEVQELDPDVFGEQLLEPGYEDVERIAAVGLSIQLTRDP
jgi:methylase of polypeptide subunit release factors